MRGRPWHAGQGQGCSAMQHSRVRKPCGAGAGAGLCARVVLVSPGRNFGCGCGCGNTSGTLRPNLRSSNGRVICTRLSGPVMLKSIPGPEEAGARERGFALPARHLGLGIDKKERFVDNWLCARQDLQVQFTLLQSIWVLCIGVFGSCWVKWTFILYSGQASNPVLAALE